MKHFDVCLHRAMLCLALLGGYVAAMAGTPLPTLYVTTADGTGITSRQEWKEHTRLRLVLPDGTVGYESSEASVRGRGHCWAWRLTNGGRCLPTSWITA